MQVSLRMDKLDVISEGPNRLSGQDDLGPSAKMPTNFCHSHDPPRPAPSTQASQQSLNTLCAVANQRPHYLHLFPCLLAPAIHGGAPRAKPSTMSGRFMASSATLAVFLPPAPFPPVRSTDTEALLSMICACH